MEYALIFIFSLIGGWISRQCGGGDFIPYTFNGWKLPWRLPTWLYGLGYAALFWHNWIYMLIAYVGAVLGKKTGHTPYYMLGNENGGDYTGRKPELDFIVTFFFGDYAAGQYWRNVFGLFVTGLAVSLIPAILMGLSQGLIPALIVAFGGMLKPVAYMFAWKFYTHLPLHYSANVYGEFLTGVFGYLAVAIAFMLNIKG